MSKVGGLPSGMPRFSRRHDREELDEAAIERFLAGVGPGPGSTPGQVALARVLASAAGPPSEFEVTGQAAAVAEFVLITSPAGRSRSRRQQARALARQALVGAVRATAAIVIAVAVTIAIVSLLHTRDHGRSQTTFVVPGLHQSPLPRAPHASPDRSR